MTEQAHDVTQPMAKPGPPAEQLGRYELLNRIGKGGMGVVYQARDTGLDRLVAVKVLLTNLEDDGEARERFLREARAAGELNHRNIIKIYDFGEDAGRAFIVMELLEGAGLNKVLEKQPDLSLDRKLEIMVGVCESLAFSHSRSTIHRDLKPANLFITKDGQVKVLDFGLAKVSSSKLTRSGLVFGTPDYMSPEQVMGKPVDARSDIFSLGAVFYQMLCGRKPFAAKSPSEVMRKVLGEDPPPLAHADAPPSLVRVVSRLLEKDRLKRYQKVQEALEDLRKIDRDEAPEKGGQTGDPRQIDRYRIEEQLGRGGMGVVYRARDPVLARDVAIKSMAVDFGADPEARARFQQEARAAAGLQHPNIVTIYEFGEKDDSPYLVMELLGGADLEALARSKTPLGLARRLEIVAQLCDGLAFAHGQGVVHRDIKPGNVRVLEDGTVRLLDFGIATAPNTDATGTFAGSHGYISPEQLSMERVDGRSDLFAVGVLAYELFTRTLPFVGDSPAAIAYQVISKTPAPMRSIAPALPEALEAVVGRALQKEPNQRWSTATEMAEAFRAVARDLQQTTPVERPKPTGSKPRMTGRSISPLMRAAALGLAVVAGAGGFYVYQMRGDGPTAAAQIENVDASDGANPDDAEGGGGGALVAPTAPNADTVQSTIASAGELFESGDRQGAFTLLDGFRPSHPDVTEELTRLRGVWATQASGLVAGARAKAANGDLEGAIAELAGFAPPHADVTAALSDLRGRLGVLGAAQSAVANARARWQAGDREEAFRILDQYSPRHELVDSERVRLRQEFDTLSGVEVDEARAQAENGSLEQLEAAVQRLAEFSPAHGLVTRALIELRAELDTRTAVRDAVDGAQGFAEDGNWTRAFAGLDNFRPIHPIVDEALKGLRAEWKQAGEELAQGAQEKADQGDVAGALTDLAAFHPDHPDVEPLEATLTALVNAPPPLEGATDRPVAVEARIPALADQADQIRASFKELYEGLDAQKMRVYPGFPTPFWGLSGFFVGDLIGKALWKLVENAQRFPRRGGRVLCVHGAVSSHRARPCATR